MAYARARARDGESIPVVDITAFRDGFRYYAAGG